MPSAIKSLTGQSCHGLEAGKFHSGYLNDKNKLFMWGKNKYGQLGLSTVDSSVLKPILVDSGYIEIEAGNLSGFMNSRVN